MLTHRNSLQTKNLCPVVIRPHSCRSEVWGARVAGAAAGRSGERCAKLCATIEDFFVKKKIIVVICYSHYYYYYYH